MSLPVKPPPTGAVHEDVAVDLIKKIPYLGKIVGWSETALDKEKNAAIEMRAGSLELWELLKVASRQNKPQFRTLQNYPRVIVSDKGYVNFLSGSAALGRGGPGLGSGQD